MTSTRGLAEMHGETASVLYMLLADRNAAIMDANMQAREAGNMEHNARVLMAERDALRIALMPFALAAPLDLIPEMDNQYVDSSSDMLYDLTYGYFRKARIALGKDHQ
jgi:hypothetical protein